MTRCKLCSGSSGSTFARLLLLIGLGLGTVAPHAAVAAYFDIIPENINHLNNPLEDMQFEPRCNLMLSGQIDGDTVSAFKEASKELESRSHLRSTNSFESVLEQQPGFRALCMSSSGGKLHDALDLIPYLDRWIAVVPAGAVCESACAIAFMGAGQGAGPYGDLGISSTNRRQARYLHYTGILAFHAPTLDDLADGPYTKEQILKEYERSRLTMGRILYRSSWDFLMRKQGNGADLPDLSTNDAIERMLNSADVDPFLPASLFYTFLITPNRSVFRVQTVEQALVWRIQIYGLSRKEFGKGIPEFWMWRTCENLAWMMCHNPNQLSGGCNTIGVTRDTFSDATTLPYVVENREGSGIERFSLRLPSSSTATIERIALGNNYQNSGWAYGAGRVKAQCGISLYRDSRRIGMRAEYHPTAASWGFGKLRSSAASNDEARWMAASRLPPESENEKIIRPWMWLSMDTRLPDIERNWTDLYDLASSEAEVLESNRYRIIRLCNFTKAPLTIALGYETDKGLKTRGWYSLETFKCFVPNGVHKGDAIYIRAQDAKGREMTVPRQSGRKTLCATKGQPFSATNNGACHRGDADAGELTTLAFSRVVTRTLVTPIVFGALPKGVAMASFRRSLLKDLNKGDK